MNPMDRVPMHLVQQMHPVQQMSPQNNVMNIIQQAKQNPRAFEEYVKQNNPQAYQQALQIRGSANPQAIIRQMAQMKGVNPSILQMLGIN